MLGTRSIIFVEDKLIVIERNKNGKEYFTLPGGHVESNETLEQCVIRESKEELGINIKILKKVYVGEVKHFNTLQHYYLCEWLDGEFGTGKGEEYMNIDENNTYRPTTISIQNIGNMNIMPPNVIKQLLKDIEKYGQKLGNEIIEIEDQ